ncbi:uncharacterized protein B0P05DRAFT_554663 [Gilbertella persicaria]|uniref:uncharacterized protein n=1 Tax=Gilbertella persicaria TaxID=101096 RepID=UPI0022208931|nr:uncharacterized protein B0P05DRAFT_554663 [Gilbertella persicaria]KAI8064861.1 hypothetical protein B0P05DRAFT_554663 [Gilbertella persicaria]
MYSMKHKQFGRMRPLGLPLSPLNAGFLQSPLEQKIPILCDTLSLIKIQHPTFTVWPRYPVNDFISDQMKQVAAVPSPSSSRSLIIRSQVMHCPKFILLIPLALTFIRVTYHYGSASLSPQKRHATFLFHMFEYRCDLKHPTIMTIRPLRLIEYFDNKQTQCVDHIECQEEEDSGFYSSCSEDSLMENHSAILPKKERFLSPEELVLIEEDLEEIQYQACQEDLTCSQEFEIDLLHLVQDTLSYIQETGAVSDQLSHLQTKMSDYYDCKYM